METPLHLFYNRRKRNAKEYANERYKSHGQKCKIIPENPLYTLWKWRNDLGRVGGEDSTTGNSHKMDQAEGCNVHGK